MEPINGTNCRKQMNPPTVPTVSTSLPSAKSSGSTDSGSRTQPQRTQSLPQYLWAKNKGYLTAEHLAAIDEYGTTKYHRQKFLENT